MINQRIIYLQQDNYKSKYLAFLRVFVSLWLLQQLLFNLKGWELFYSNESPVKVNATSFVNLIGLNTAFLKNHYTWLIAACIISSLLNCFGIGKFYTSVFFYVSYNLLYALNNKITNSGNNMALILAFYLCFANSYHYLCFKKKPKQPQSLANLITNLAVYAILINLCLSYAIAGWEKLQDVNWQNGTAVYYVLNHNRYASFSFNKTLSSLSWFVYFATYATLFVELSFGFLVWIKRFRFYILIACFLMHAFIYTFMGIHAMSIIFVIQYPLFYDDSEFKFRYLFIAKNGF